MSRHNPNPVLEAAFDELNDNRLIYKTKYGEISTIINAGRYETIPGTVLDDAVVYITTSSRRATLTIDQARQLAQYLLDCAMLAEAAVKDLES